MDKIIVYIDDADYAAHQLAPMKQQATGVSCHWIVVACPPRMTRHISKWVSHSARENWRQKWAAKLLARISPHLKTHGDQLTLVLSHGPLLDLTQSLLSQYGAARVLDARRPKFGQDMAPVTPGQPSFQDTGLSLTGAVAGLGAAMLLAAE